jgi:hypothetical protein
MDTVLVCFFIFCYNSEVFEAGNFTEKGGLFSSQF